MVPLTLTSSIKGFQRKGIYAPCLSEIYKLQYHSFKIKIELILFSTNNYRLLRDVSEKNKWQPWILYMLEGTEQTAKFTVKLVENIRILFDETAKNVKAKLLKIYSRELVDILFEQPYCRGQNLIEAGIASRNRASKYLKALTDIGVLELHRVWKENLYLNVKLWKLLKMSWCTRDKKICAWDNFHAQIIKNIVHDKLAVHKKVE